MSIALRERPAAVPTAGDTGPRPPLDPVLDAVPVPADRRSATATCDPDRHLEPLAARARPRRRASMAALAIPVMACLTLSTPIQHRQMQLPHPPEASPPQHHDRRVTYRPLVELPHPVGARLCG